MESKSFNAQLAKKLDQDASVVASTAEQLTQLISALVVRTDTVAIPGFGTFTPVKTDEYVSDEVATGKRMLMPPSITLTFKAGSRLKKATAPKS